MTSLRLPRRRVDRKKYYCNIIRLNLSIIGDNPHIVLRTQQQQHSTDSLLGGGGPRVLVGVKGLVVPVRGSIVHRTPSLLAAAESDSKK